MAFVAAVLDKADELCSNGLNYLAALRVEEAMTCFSRAIYLQPNVAVFHAYRGDCCLALCDLTGALASYRKALRLTPHDTTTTTTTQGAGGPQLLLLSQRALLAERFTRLLLCLARLHIAEGALPAAQASLAEAQALAPWDPLLWVHRTAVFLAARQWRGAAAQLGAVLEPAAAAGAGDAIEAALAESAEIANNSNNTDNNCGYGEYSVANMPPPQSPALLRALSLARVPVSQLQPEASTAAHGQSVAVTGPQYGPMPAVSLMDGPWVALPFQQQQQQMSPRSHQGPQPSQSSTSSQSQSHFTQSPQHQQQQQQQCVLARAVPTVASSWATPQTAVEAAHAATDWLNHRFAVHLPRWLLLAAVEVALDDGDASVNGASDSSATGMFGGDYPNRGAGGSGGGGSRCVMLVPVPLFLEAVLLRARTRLALDELALARDDLALAHAALPTLPEVAELTGALSSAAGALALRARAHIMVRAPEAAIAELTHALVLCPRDVRLLHLRATARKQMGDLPGALEDLQAALLLFAEARAADEARYRDAVTQHAEQRARLSLQRTAARAAAGGSADPGTTFLTGLADNENNDNGAEGEEAERLLEVPDPALFSTAPTDVLPALQRLLAASLAAMGDAMRAKLPRIAPAPLINANAATAHSSAKHGKTMVGRGSSGAAAPGFTLSSATITTTPTTMTVARGSSRIGRNANSPAVAAQAKAEAEGASWTAVLALYTRAAELEPALASHWVRRGDAHADAGSLELALADYEQAAVCEREDSFSSGASVRPLTNAPWAPSTALRARLARVRGEVARALFNGGRLAEAEAELTRALAAAPGFAALYIQRSLVRERLTMLVGAIKDAQMAAQLAPGDAVAKQRLALLAAKYGRAVA